MTPEPQYRSGKVVLEEAGFDQRNQQWKYVIAELWNLTEIGQHGAKQRIGGSLLEWQVTELIDSATFTTRPYDVVIRSPDGSIGGE